VATKTPEALAAERNILVLRTIASAERTIAANHRRRDAGALADVHDCAAEQLTDLLGVLNRTYGTTCTGGS